MGLFFFSFSFFNSEILRSEGTIILPANLPLHLHRRAWCQDASATDLQGLLMGQQAC